MSGDWQSALQGLLNEPTLPQGEETAPKQDEVKTPAQKGKLAVQFEKKGRGGKQVTIISGFTIDQEQLLELAAKLKSKLGTGGSARGGEILIQGDRREDVKKLLTGLGYKL